MLASDLTLTLVLERMHSDAVRLSRLPPVSPADSGSRSFIQLNVLRSWRFNHELILGDRQIVRQRLDVRCAPLSVGSVYRTSAMNSVAIQLPLVLITAGLPLCVNAFAIKYMDRATTSNPGACPVSIEAHLTSSTVGVLKVRPDDGEARLSCPLRPACLRSSV
jgi:hypothetical protein